MLLFTDVYKCFAAVLALEGGLPRDTVPILVQVLSLSQLVFIPKNRGSKSHLLGGRLDPRCQMVPALSALVSLHEIMLNSTWQQLGGVGIL